MAGILNALGAAQESGFFSTKNLTPYAIMSGGINASRSAHLPAGKSVRRLSEITFAVYIVYMAANVCYLIGHAHAFNGGTKVFDLPSICGAQGSARTWRTGLPAAAACAACRMALASMP
jgi:hypothetical protein